MGSDQGKTYVLNIMLMTEKNQGSAVNSPGKSYCYRSPRLQIRIKRFNKIQSFPGPLSEEIHPVLSIA